MMGILSWVDDCGEASLLFSFLSFDIRLFWVVYQGFTCYEYLQFQDNDGIRLYKPVICHVKTSAVPVVITSHSWTGRC